MKASIKKNTRTGANPRQSRKLSPFDTVPVLHADKIEMRILHTSAYLLDPGGFAEIRSMLESELHVKWRPPTQPESLSKWTWVASNEDFRITFIGTTAHLEDRRAWLSKPFPSSDDLSDRLRWWSYIGLIRLTSKTHDSVLYLKHVSKFFELIERLGIYEVPREIEIAADVPNNPTGRRLAMCVRPKRDNPLDLAHFRIGYGNSVFEGPSRDGMNEYCNFATFPGNDVFSQKRKKNNNKIGGRLQLKVYPSRHVRPGTDDIRIELALGPRRLREIMKSPNLVALKQSDSYPFLQRSYPVKAISPTLELLAFIDNFFCDNILVQDLDEQKIRRKYPVLRYQPLNKLSIRGKRFKAISMGLTPAQFETCTVRGRFPQSNVLYPDQYKDANSSIYFSLIKVSLDLHTPPHIPSFTRSHTTSPEITPNQPSPPTAHVFSGTYVPKSEPPAETNNTHSEIIQNCKSIITHQTSCTGNNNKENEPAPKLPPTDWNNKRRQNIIKKDQQT